MKIFVISRGVPSSDDPQWGNFEWDQVLALRACGHEVCVLSVESRKKTKFQSLRLEKRVIEGISHYNIVCGPVGALKYLNDKVYISVLSFFFRRLYRHVASIEGKPDIIYAHYSHIIAMASNVAGKINVPIVGMEHWSELGKPEIKPSILKRSISAYQNIDRLLVVSSALQSNIRRLIGADSVVVPNIVGKEFYYNPIARDAACVEFISTGNLLPIKCMDLIVQAFSMIKDQMRDWHLTIVGAGPEYAILQELIEENRLSDRIRLVGRKTREEIVRLLNGSDVYIMASSSETFGVAAAEAISCGLPVITTACGGPSDFVSESNGVVIPVHDVTKLSEAILYMYGNHSSFDRKAISEGYRNNFSAEAIAAKLSAIFDDVTKQHKHKR